VIPTLGNFVQRHAEAVASMHNVCALYIKEDPTQKEDILLEDEFYQGVKTTVVYYRSGGNTLWRRWRAFQKGIAFLKKQDRFHFDVVQFNIIWNCAWQAWWLKKRYGIPYIISENYTGFDTTSRSDQPRGLKFFSKIITRNAAYVCPVTKNLEQVMKNYGLTGNYWIVPNVVNTDLFQLHQPSDDVIKFLHVSTLNDAHKNISGMLRCWKKVSDQLQNVHISIGGDGPYQDFEKMAEELQIRKESISFFGVKTPSEVAQLMSTSHCLVLFSNYENLPLVIVEALASGLAIISTNAGGVSEHIDSQLGIVIQKRDEQALTMALIEFVATRGRFKAEVQRKYAVEHFSIPSISKQFDAVYQSAIGKK
jgi:glycosyltransferase involved in cell wall biosynthesis